MGMNVRVEVTATLCVFDRVADTESVCSYMGLVCVCMCVWFEDDAGGD